MPLGTMLEFRSFSQDDVVTIQPRDLRARIQVEEPVRADTENSVLSLRLTNERGMREFSFPLRLVDERSIDEVSGLFSNQPGKTEYTFELSDEAVTSFKEAQDSIQNEPSGSFNFSVRTGFNELPHDASEIRLSVFLKLSEERGFVTLFNNATLNVQHSG